MRGPGAHGMGRLIKRADFLFAAAGGRFHSERVTVQGRFRPEGGNASSGSGLRIGFTVTKRVGHATERNRIRRRLRAAALDAGLSRADMPLDVVVVARRETLAAAYEDLVEDLRRALHAVTRPRRPRAEQPSSTSTGGGRAGDRPGGTA